MSLTWLQVVLQIVPEFELEVEDTNLPGVPAGGDLIIAIDGHEVLSFNDLIVYLTLFKSPGDLGSLIHPTW